MLICAFSELERTLEIIWMNILVLQMRFREFVSKSRPVGWFSLALVQSPFQYVILSPYTYTELKALSLSLFIV